MAGFYYVRPDGGIEGDFPESIDHSGEDEASPEKKIRSFQCRARGLFRKKGISPLVGDRVIFELTDTEDVEGNIVEILERKNSLLRPQVANVDQALVIFAFHTPEPALDLLDRFLVGMRKSGIDVVLVFNKDDLKDPGEPERYRKIYARAGVGILFTSVALSTGIEEVREILKGKLTTVAGPSGAGKSSLINAISGRKTMETGELSRKIGRGKQTTRHVELIEIEEDSYIIDTPGFSSLELPDVDVKELDLLFPEIGKYKNECYFAGCSHINEPDCMVKEKLREGEIPEERYSSYSLFYQEIMRRRRY